MSSLIRQVRPAGQQIFFGAGSCQGARTIVSFSSSRSAFKTPSCLQSMKKQNAAGLATSSLRNLHTSLPLHAEESAQSKPTSESSSKSRVWSAPTATSSTPGHKPQFAHVEEMSHEDLDGIYLVPHFRHPSGDVVEHGTEADLRLPHPVWSRDELDNQVSPHQAPKGLIDRAAYMTVKTLRVAFDVFTGYSLGFRDEKCYLRRIIFLETVAGVPGMVGAMNRHLSSLRTMQRDCGWIHTLLEEAENERMHLMIAMCLREPSFMIRMNVLIAQGFFLTWYSLMYALSPKYCHRFVGYLEEEAFKTYTALVNHFDSGELPDFDKLAPSAVQKYYRLGSSGTLRDVFLAMRADENHHREVNHCLANIGKNATNPFPPGF